MQRHIRSHHLLCGVLYRIVICCLVLCCVVLCCVVLCCVVLCCVVLCCVVLCCDRWVGKMYASLALSPTHSLVTLPPFLPVTLSVSLSSFPPLLYLYPPFTLPHRFLSLLFFQLQPSRDLWVIPETEP